VTFANSAIKKLEIACPICPLIGSDFHFHPSISGIVQNQMQLDFLVKWEGWKNKKIDEASKKGKSKRYQKIELKVRKWGSEGIKGKRGLPQSHTGPAA